MNSLFFEIPEFLEIGSQPYFFCFLQVVGIEMNASAVSDAHRNAEINGIKNIRFICSKVR